MVMGVGRALVELDGTAKHRFGIVKLAVLQSNEPETENGIDVARIRADHDLIELLRLPQPPLRMESGRPLERECRTDARSLQQPRYMLGHPGSPDCCRYRMGFAEFYRTCEMCGKNSIPDR